MDNNFGTFKAARLPSVDVKKLPGNITHAKINTAILPAQLEAARTAIARCTDLSELLAYRDKAEGLAAAVRTMKQVGPEMIRQANEIMADAWRKGGELLSQYSNAPIPTCKKEKFSNIHPGSNPSQRVSVAMDMGLSKRDVTAMVRIAKAPLPKVYSEVQKSSSLKHVAIRVPPINTKYRQSAKYSEPCREILGGGTSTGLSPVLANLRRVPLDQFKLLTPDERKIVKAKITEITELLDEMDRLCR